MAIPQPRAGHCCVSVYGKILVWGGDDNHGQTIPASVIETFGPTSGQWGSILTTGTAPLVVWRSAIVGIDNSVYGFGGMGTEGQLSKDLHHLDSTLMEWTKVESFNPSEGPSPMAGCGMIRRGGEELVVVGGWFGGQEATNEVHAIHIREGIWYAPTVTGDVPPPCDGFSLLNIDEYHAVFFGEYMEGQECSSDVYYLDLRMWSFVKVRTAGSSRPRGRGYHAAVIIRSSLVGSRYSQLLIIGGWNGETLWDAWTADLGPTVDWNEIDLPPGVGPRLHHTATVISSGHGSALVLVHGGWRELYGDPVSATAVIHLEAVITMDTPPQWRAVEVVAMKDHRMWKELFGQIQKLGQLHSVLKAKKTTASKSANMVVNGPPGSGKSTVIHRAIHDLCATVRALNFPSTPILEKPMIVGIKKLVQERAAVEGSLWVAQTIQDDTRRALQRSLTLVEDTNVQERDSNPAQVSSTSGEPQPPPPSTHSPQPMQSTDVGSQPLQSTSGQDPSEPPSGPLLPTIHLDTMPSFQSPDEMIRKALRNLDALKDLHDLEGTTVLHIVDTGGQPEFQSVLSWLLLKPAITVQVFNLSIGLKERYDVWYRAQDGRTTEPYKSSFTVEEVLFQAQSSIAYLETSPCPSELPFEVVPFQSKSIFVGTHRDLVSEEVVSHVDSTLQNQLKCSSFPSDRVVYHRDPLTSSINVVVPIDNTNPNDPGIRRFQELVNDILKEVPSSQLPVSWEWFKLSVLSTNAKTMTVDQCAVIGKASGMEDKSEVELALWYYTHFTGQIQHYNIEGIEDTVWLDPQLISDGMSSLVSLSFHWRGPMDRRQVTYQETGRFPVVEVKKVMKECCQEVPSEKLITLFEYLHIFSPIHDEDGRTVEYFVPCALQPEKVESLKRGPPSASHPAPLLFTFNTGFTPIGVFHVLVVYLSSPGFQEGAPLHWELCIYQFRNKVTFFVGVDLDEVTLIARPQFIEVQINRPTETDFFRSLSAVCKDVRSTLDAALTHVKSSKKSILRVSHQAAVYCERSQCDATPHYALRRGNGPPWNAMCSFSRYPCRLGPYQRIWFDEGGGESTLESATTKDSYLGSGGGSRQNTGGEKGATAQSTEGHTHRPLRDRQQGQVEAEGAVYYRSGQRRSQPTSSDGYPPRKAICLASSNPSSTGHTLFTDSGGGPQLESTADDGHGRGGDGSQQYTGRDKGATAQTTDGHTYRPPWDRQQVQIEQQTHHPEDHGITSEDFAVFNNHPPELHELCDAAAEIAHLYDQIGIGLGLTHGQLRIIQANTAGRPNQMQLCLTEVFSYWRSGRTLPYTWETFASVLLQPRLAPEAKLLLTQLHKNLAHNYSAIHPDGI